MISGRRANHSPGLDAALAGLQAGTVAVFAMLALVGLATAFYRRSFWYAANVMASTFYGDDAIRAGFSWQTVSGTALYLVLYGAFGALFGSVVRDRFPRLRITLLAIAAGLAWYYLWFSLLWPRLNPLIPLYTYDRAMLWSHLLYGLMLARFPMYLDRLAPRPATPPPALPSPEPPGEPAAREVQPEPAAPPSSEAAPEGRDHS